jgi:hypothetical protein
MSEGVQVTVGQVWADDDPRKRGRQVEITEVDLEQNRARGKVIKVSYNVSESHEGARTRWIALARFRPGRRGYRLVENPAEASAAEQAGPPGQV